MDDAINSITTLILDDKDGIVTKLAESMDRAGVFNDEWTVYENEEVLHNLNVADKIVSIKKAILDIKSSDVSFETSSALHDVKRHVQALETCILVRSRLEEHKKSKELLANMDTEHI